MNIARMHHQIKFDYNKLNTNHNRDFPKAFLDDLINTSQDDLVEILFSGNNSKQFKLGFEATQQRLDLISNLVISYPLQTDLIPSFIDTDGPLYHVYEFPFSSLDYSYAHLVKTTALTSCGELRVSIERHQDLDNILRDDLRKPSSFWKRLVGTIRANSNSTSTPSSSLYIYSPTNINVNKLRPTYIKTPQRVFIGGYNSLEFELGLLDAYNTSTLPVDCELPTIAANAVVDIAVQSLARNLGDINHYNLQKDELQMKL